MKRPGNEFELLKYLLNNKSSTKLNHIGKVRSIKVPKRNNDLVEVTQSNIESFFSDDATKKSDIYINDIGISIKQEGPSALYNKAQRKGIIENDELINCFNDKDEFDLFISNLDQNVTRYHKKMIKRDVPWKNVIKSKDSFRKFLFFLMMVGFVEKSKSVYTANYILEAPKKIKNSNEINLYTFPDYFDKYENRIFFSIRPVWFGMGSDSEHGRATSIMKHEHNLPWVFDNVSGKPRSGWSDKILKNDRKTVYYINVNKAK